MNQNPRQISLSTEIWRGFAFGRVVGLSFADRGGHKERSAQDEILANRGLRTRPG